MLRRSVITLLSDFGSDSVYVAELKGVLLGLASESQIVDLSHSISPYNVAQAERFLRRSAFLFPRGTVHLVIVDPGVGSARKGLALYVQGHYFVGPDNGVLSHFAELEGAKIVNLDRPEFFRKPIAPTFHGRDIFAPVAARLATGMLLESLGSPLKVVESLQHQGPREEGKSIKGDIVDADRFGNLMTNIPAVLAPESADVRIGSHKAQWVKCYSEGSGNTLLALEGSGGFVELALKEGSAAAFLGYPDVGEVSICK
ncbi:MAG: SAM-dependent chlorinase/fluorinase [Myxococcota bacterium]|jgi:hypothetical protein|nr:SAM-dependent chlorinase/fluorinase [Myxococcota bacterium]